MSRSIYIIIEYNIFYDNEHNKESLSKKLKNITINSYNELIKYQILLYYSWFIYILLLANIEYFKIY